MPIMACPIPGCTSRVTGSYEFSQHLFIHPEVTGLKYTPAPGHDPEDKFHCLVRNCHKWFQDRDQVCKHVDTHTGMQRPAELLPGSQAWEKWGGAHQAFEEVSAEAGRAVRFGPGPDYPRVSLDGEELSEKAPAIFRAQTDYCVGLTEGRRTI